MNLFKISLFMLNNFCLIKDHILAWRNSNFLNIKFNLFQIHDHNYYLIQEIHLLFLNKFIYMKQLLFDWKKYYFRPIGLLVWIKTWNDKMIHLILDYFIPRIAFVWIKEIFIRKILRYCQGFFAGWSYYSDKNYTSLLIVLIWNKSWKDFDSWSSLHDSVFTKYALKAFIFWCPEDTTILK